eukprot:UN02388
MLTSFRVLSLLISSSKPFSSSMASWASQPTFYHTSIIFSSIENKFYFVSSIMILDIMALKCDEIAYPKTSFSKILKYGENKQSQVFAIGNTIVI